MSGTVGEARRKKHVSGGGPLNPLNKKTRRQGYEMQN